MGNTALSPAASNIIVACDFHLPPSPAVPRVILNDLCERIGDLVDHGYSDEAAMMDEAPIRTKRARVKLTGTRVQ